METERKKECRVLDKLPPGATCCFCKCAVQDNVMYGQFYQCRDIICHYYCLLLSSNMAQHGNDDEGILGFLPVDIKSEIARGRRTKCSYCKKTGATIGCDKTQCKATFHLPCGIKHESLHQFFGQFKSFCSKHRPIQKIDAKVLLELAQLKEGMDCPICKEKVATDASINTLWASCCRKSAWFHRRCVQEMALNAGYFFKCPLCNNKDIFLEEMRTFGIYIPECDASWEREPNAFQELLYAHNRCDTLVCLCPQGRDYSVSNLSWKIVRCSACGSQGTHLRCANLKSLKRLWHCSVCVALIPISDDDSSSTTSSSSSCSSSTLSVGSASPPARRRDNSDSETLVPELNSQSSSASIIRETFPTPSQNGPREMELQRVARPVAENIRRNSQIVDNLNKRLVRQDSSSSVSSSTLSSSSQVKSEVSRVKLKPAIANGVKETAASEIISLDSSDESDIEVISEIRKSPIKFTAQRKTIITTEGTKIKVHPVLANSGTSEVKEVGAVVVNTGNVAISAVQPQRKSGVRSMSFASSDAVSASDCDYTPTPEAVRVKLGDAVSIFPVSNSSKTTSESSSSSSSSHTASVEKSPPVVSSSSLDKDGNMGLQILDVRHSTELFSGSDAVDKSSQVVETKTAAREQKIEFLERPQKRKRNEEQPIVPTTPCVPSTSNGIKYHYKQGFPAETAVGALSGLPVVFVPITTPEGICAYQPMLAQNGHEPTKRRASSPEVICID